MTDIVPGLLEEIQDDFTNRVGRDKILAELGELVSKGEASYKEAADYAARLGKILSDVLQDHISTDMLPDGRMYYNIAERILGPTLTNNYELASNIAAQVQESLNQAAHIGLKAVRPLPDPDSLEGFINKVSEAESFDKVSWMLKEPITNFTMSAVDDTLRENVEFHGRAGLSPKITRISTGGCCEWCSELAGEYDYPVNREVYRRHNYCRCIVLYDPGDGKVQNVHSKVVYANQAQAERDARIERALQIENQKKQIERASATIREKIKKDEYSLKQKDQKYYEHVRGTPQWISTMRGRPGRDLGELTISKEEAQEIIYRFSGRGIPRISKNGIPSGIEYVTTDRVVGKYFDAAQGKWVETKRVAIHHGKDGSHIVPVKPGGKK